MATTIHFHGGPWAGKESIVEKLPLRVDIRVPDLDSPKPHRMKAGRYTPDPDSAGGRCYDWQGWN